MRKYKKDRIGKKILGLLVVGIVMASLVIPTSKNVKAASVSVDTSTGLVTSINSMNDSEFKNAVYCSPDASGSGSGASNSPMTLAAALTLSKTTDGIAILLKSGTYSFGSEITIAYGNNGSSGAYKVLKAADGADVTFDFSSQAYSTGARGLKMDGNYWYVYGIRIKGAADNGIYLSGSNNVIERCILEGNRDSGLQVSRRDSSLSNIADWPSNNYIINCTAFDNDDPATHENADGFAAKLTCGQGNVFDGCISYCNIDDGWDLYAKTETGSIGIVTIRNCVSMSNGTKTNGTTSTNGDRNGFKLGGNSGISPTPHVVYNCIAINNGADGFTDNGNGAALSIFNCTSYNNAGGNFVFDRTNGGIYTNILSVTGHSSDKFVGTIDNSVYFNSSKYYKVTSATAVTSGAKVGTNITAPASSNFTSLFVPAINSNIDSSLRNPDGTINVNGLLMKSDGTFAGMGAEFGVSTRTLSLHVSTGGGGTVVAPTTAPTEAPVIPTTVPATDAAVVPATVGTTTAEIHSAAQVVDAGTIVKAEAVADILKTAANETVVDIVTNEATVLENTVFTDIAGKDNTVKLDIVNAENQMVYSWSFDGKTVDISNLAADMKLDLSISFEIDQEKQKAIEKLNSNKDKFYLLFAQQGELPGIATIKVYVGNVYADGSKLSLNYYNEENGKIDLVNDGLTVLDGYVEFTISHCSTYFLTKNETPSVSTNASIQEAVVGASQTTGADNSKSNLVVVICIIVAVLAAAGIAFAFVLKKRKFSENSNFEFTIDTEDKKDTEDKIDTEDKRI